MPFHIFDLTDNRQLYFKVQGEKGPRLILIHSSLSSHIEWKYQGPIADHAVLTFLDLPGHGESDPLPVPVTIVDFVAVLSLFLRSNNLVPAIIVGHSIGGAIALQLALDYHQLVNGLILIGTGAKLGVFPAILEGLKTHYEKAIELTLGQLMFGKNADPNLVKHAKEEALRCPKSVGLADFLACNTFDVRTRLHEIKVPTLIIVGDEDKLTPPKWSHYLKDQISGSRLEVIPGSGHFVMQEQPEAVNHAILMFLNAHEWV
ncbi:MAG: alpha/beta fold hydrolase [Candidatus Hodarchaeota archaeon]